MNAGVSTRRRWVAAAAVLALALGVAVWSWTTRDGNGTEYQTAQVSRGDVTAVVTATGQLNPVVNVQVGSQISGIIQRIFVDFNSRVTAGQVLAKLDPATYLANLRQAEGELANARAALELARVKAARAAELRAKDLIPQADHDEAQADLSQARATVTIKEAAVQKARVDVARCTIVAPIDGVVISRSVDVGQTVAASFSAPTLFVIANDLAKMQINANVAEADIGGIAIGQEVTFSVDAFPGQTFRGTVTQVRNAPITVQNVVTYDTIIGVENPDLRLRPGMTANVAIVLARREGVFVIPNAALRFRPPDLQAAETRSGPSHGTAGGRSSETDTGDRPSTRTVYVLPGTPTAAGPIARRVQVGISNGTITEVVEGLGEGDRVVTGLRVEGTESTRRTTSPFGGMRRF